MIFGSLLGLYIRCLWVIWFRNPDQLETNSASSRVLKENLVNWIKLIKKTSKNEDLNWSQVFRNFLSTKRLFDLKIEVFKWISNLSIYIKVTVCTYVPFSCPNRRTNLHQILSRPPHQLREGSYYKHDPANLIPGPRGTPKPKWVTERKLCVT